MSALREDAIIKTPTGELRGHLYVGVSGLPELRVRGHDREFYSTSTFPAAWTLQQAELGDVGILFESWRTISEMQFEIAQAQREAEAKGNG